MNLLVGKTSEGRYKNWNKDKIHRRQSKELGVFPDIWIADDPSQPAPQPQPATSPPASQTPVPQPAPQPGGGPLPWRLTKEQRLLLDLRTRRIVWPHYMERLYYRGASMWKKPCRMWKCRRKYRLLYHVLPIQLRDQVPILRRALVLFAWAMRRYAGQVYSYEAAKAMGILPGSRVLVAARLKTIKGDLICAIVLLEGCVPIAYLIPTWHHFVHYPEYAETHGILRILWMMAFER